MRHPVLPGRRTLRLVAAGVLLTAAAVTTAGPTSATPSSGAVATTGVTAPALPRSALAGALEATGYWTAEKMRNAVPADLPVDTAPTGSAARTTGQTTTASASGVIARPVASRATGQGTAAAPVPATTGKLFYTTPTGADGYCSASVINSPGKNLVMTAGRCVHGGPGGSWNTNFVFAPSYHYGASAAGVWNYAGGRVFEAWANNGNPSFDQAFLTMHQRAGQNLVDVVGANGLLWTNVGDQPGTQIWGWPVEPPYDGQSGQSCEGAAFVYDLFDAAMDCPMTGGATGGPWTKDRIDANVGFVWAVTSRRTLFGTPRLLAAPNSIEVKTLYDSVAAG